MSNEIAKKEETNIVQHPAVSQTGAVMATLMSALEGGNLQPEQLGMILDAQERVLDRQAKQDFAIAMAECQSEMPNILKTKDNNQTKSKYESLDALNKVVSPVYTKHGFSVTFGTDTAHEIDNPMIRVTAEVSHKGGWSKEYHYDLPYDMAGIAGTINKTKIHASGSTLSYGRRYLLKLIFNLTTVDEHDDDGNSAGISEFELISKELERHRAINKSIIDHVDVISTIKYGIDVEMLADAAEAWFKLSDDEKKSLWIAPTKGGAFSTKEREVIKSSEFRKAYFGEDEDDAQ
jgi:hypothetical protein